MPKTYPAPWQGQLLLACKKCQKRMKKDGGPKELASLKKTIKARNKEGAALLHVLPMGCVDLCPKKGIVVCLPAESATSLRILWSPGDLDALQAESSM